MTIKSVETENQGLKRAFMLTIPAQDIEARVDQEVKRIAPQVRMAGFRPGKVPPNLIRKMHGESIQRDALSVAVQDGVQELLAQQKLRPALQPEVQLDESYEPGKDAQVSVKLEALPDLPPAEIDGLKLERLTVEADEEAVEAQLKQLASSNKKWTDAPEGHAAALGDMVVMDFVGSVDGVKFEGGAGEDMSLELGSGQLIPGFEDGLVGAKAGEQRDVNVTFPENYQAETLAGKAAVFACTVKSVKTAGEAAIDEDFAKSLGLQSLEQLRGLLRDQQQQELNGLTRTHMKRQLLDQLAAKHDFVVPESMVAAEFENIMRQLRHEAGHEADPAAALAEIETEAGDYRKIAERRVRLGLLLSDIGQGNNIEISQQEMNRLIGQAAAQYQGKDRERFIQYVQQEPTAAAQLRAPLYEDKVVDWLFSHAEISERAATRGELEADLESEEGHVHGPDCGHAHAQAAPAAEPVKAKGKGKKAKPAASEAEVAEPAAEAAPAEVAPAEAPVAEAPVADAKPAKAKAAPKKVKLTEDASDAPKPAKPLKSEPADKAAAAAAGDAKPAKKPAKKSSKAAK